MTTRRTYRGFGLSGIDGKGRVAIPAKLRATIEGNSDNERIIALSKSRSTQCLNGYDLSYSDNIADDVTQQIADRDADAPRISRDNLTRMAFGMVEDVPFDASGRMVIPPIMRKLGKLEDLAFFNGFGSVIEIWNPYILIETPDIAPDFVDMVKWLLEERGVK